MVSTHLSAEYNSVTVVVMNLSVFFQKDDASVCVSYPQSGAGHHLQSGSATSHLLNMNSSYLSMSARSPRMMQMSCGLNRSEHSGQLMLTRDSEISMRRYWRRQSMQERW